eukprot:14246846-Ditylum_brightwellii.AAC.1
MLRKYANNSDGQNLSRQGSNNDLLHRYCQKHSTINLLRVNEEGDETSDDSFDRDGDGHYGNRHDGDGNEHGGDRHGSDVLHSMPCSLRH